MGEGVHSLRVTAAGPVLLLLSMARAKLGYPSQDPKTVAPGGEWCWPALAWGLLGARAVVREELVPGLGILESWNWFG